VDSCNLTQDKVDYEDYPHLTCDNIDAKRNQAEDIKERLLKAQTKQDLTLIREEYSSRCDWVWKNLLTNAQRRTLKELAAIEQLNLLATPQVIATQSINTEASENAAPLEREEDDLSEWLTPEELEGMARDLALCEDADTLAYLRECWNPQAMNRASKMLPPEKHSQVKEWVLQLNTFVPTKS
jgi:putative DNA primase/helicase